MIQMCEGHVYHEGFGYLLISTVNHLGVKGQSGGGTKRRVGGGNLTFGLLDFWTFLRFDL